MSKIISLCVFLCAFAVAPVYAQEHKVVVVPLNSSQKIARSGETFAGQLSYYHQAGSTSSFGVAGASFPKPLPIGTEIPILEGLVSTSANCPGIGQAKPGYLCVYTYHTNNFDFLSYSGGSTGENRLYGFSLDIFFTSSSSQGWVLSSWAYTVP